MSERKYAGVESQAMEDAISSTSYVRTLRMIKLMVREIRYIHAPLLRIS